MKDHPATLAIHAGETAPKPYGALTTPIVQTSTYTFADTAEVLTFMQRKAEREAAREAGEDRPLRDEYGRYGNPTQRAAAQKIAALEGGERALLFATGMSAITTTMLTLLSAGDHAVVVRECYRRTRQFAQAFLPRWGIETTLVSIDAPLVDALRPNTRLIFAETPTNPYLRVMDLTRLAEIARLRGILTAVDSTFATPLNVRPLDLGIDLVVHSATKYLGGHNDLLAGVVVGPGRLLNPIEATRGVLGGVGSPHDAYLLLRGLKTLALRVERQNASALRIAQFLARHPAVDRVHYPGLPDHPDHDVARRQMAHVGSEPNSGGKPEFGGSKPGFGGSKPEFGGSKPEFGGSKPEFGGSKPGFGGSKPGFGGVVSFEVAGGKAATSRFIDRLRVPYIGPTLGGVESIVQQQALFISLDPEERRAAGISDNLVRYAVGLEDPDDLIADLDQALAR